MENSTARNLNTATAVHLRRGYGVDTKAMARLNSEFDGASPRRQDQIMKEMMKIEKRMNRDAAQHLKVTGVEIWAQ